MDEEDFPTKKAKVLKDLAPLSIAELQEYILTLKNEIERVEQDIGRKKAHLAGAASIFKK